MKPVAKIIHRTYVSYLPTAFPAHYYGMPNGKIFLVFSRFYEEELGKTGLEFVFAEHKDFYFDYKNDTILPASENSRQEPVFSEQVDYPMAKYHIFNISREFKSYGQAQIYLNEQAGAMMQTA